MDSRDFCGFLWVSGEFLQISVEFNGFLENFYGFSKMDFDGSLENFNGFENLYGFDVVVSMPLPTFHGDMKKRFHQCHHFAGCLVQKDHVRFLN